MAEWSPENKEGGKAVAALRTVAGEWADEIREGIAWVIVWKTGRSWNAQAVWLDPYTDTFEQEDLWLARRILEEDPGAVMLNSWYCGHLGEDMTVAELAAGIRWHYEHGYNMLDGSTAFPPEPVERPADLPADIPWYGGDGTEMDPYVYDGYMSLEDWGLMHRYIEEERKLPQEPHQKEEKDNGDSGIRGKVSLRDRGQNKRGKGGRREAVFPWGIHYHGHSLHLLLKKRESRIHIRTGQLRAVRTGQGSEEPGKRRRTELKRHLVDRF